MEGLCADITGDGRLNGCLLRFKIISGVWSSDMSDILKITLVSFNWLASSFCSETIFKMTSRHSSVSRSMLSWQMNDKPNLKGA